MEISGWFYIVDVSYRKGRNIIVTFYHQSKVNVVHDDIILRILLLY